MKQFVLSIMLCFSVVCMAQNVTIRAVNQPASVVFRSIVEQTGKNFVYSSELLKNMHVSVNVKNKPLKQTLSIIFKDTDIKYEIKGRNIILKRKPKSKSKNVNLLWLLHLQLYPAAMLSFRKCLRKSLLYRASKPRWSRLRR